MKYEQLTDKQRQYICNGCGGKGGLIKPPKSKFFKASCDHHDYGYWKGGKEDDRKKCDEKFFKFMKQDIQKLNFFDKIRYYAWCVSYYIAVRKFGSKYFYFTDKKRKTDDYNWATIYLLHDHDEIIDWENFLL